MKNDSLPPDVTLHLKKKTICVHFVHVRLFWILRVSLAHSWCAELVSVRGIQLCTVLTGATCCDSQYLFRKCYKYIFLLNVKALPASHQLFNIS